MLAQGDTHILATTGYELRKDIVRGGSADILPAPDAFRVTHGAKSGSFDIHLAKLLGAGSYEVQITESDPSIEANWRLMQKRDMIVVNGVLQCSRES